MQSRIKSFHRSPSRAGFTMIELIVVIAIISLLMSITIPAATRVREAARRMQCMNNVRNLGLALISYEYYHNRYPASGYYYDPPHGGAGPHHTWAVGILPFIDQQPLFDQWQFDRNIVDPANQPLTRAHIPLFICPLDISRNKDKEADMSYAVNGGWGLTFRKHDGVGDCVMHFSGPQLDLNGDGKTCTGDPALDDQDRSLFKATGMFFLENWKFGGTVRHHSAKDITDGMSQTFLLSENVRAGFSPSDPVSGFADPNPYRCAFYAGLPCPGGLCVEGNVDYNLANSKEEGINSGLWKAEGSSPVPNSFHPGGVMMCYVDGHVKFLNQEIDGKTYAAMFSPQGSMLDGTPLKQGLVSGDVY